MDEIDMKIISELMDDARIPFKKIAEKLGVSTPTISKRYSELKKQGIIKSCSIKLDLSKLGYKGTAHLLFTSIGTNTCQEGFELIQELNKTPDIIIASSSIGDYEAYAVLAFKNIEDLYSKLLEIKSLCSSTEVELSIGMPGIDKFPPNRNPFNISAL
jgi:Lrp/AsnC family transcriptional regulator for asnA, asnC and gidA